MATPKKSFATPKATARNWSWQFGLLSFDVSLTKLFRDSDRYESKSLCPVHHVPIHQGPMVCEGEDWKKHTVKQPLKGFQYEQGKFAILTEEERTAIPDEHTGAIELKALVPVTMLDPAMYESTYLCWPTNDVALSRYTIMERYAIEYGVAFIGEGTWWGSTRAIVLRHDYARGVMILSTCAYQALERTEDVKTVLSIERPEIAESDWKMAEMVFGSLPTEFDFSTVTDKVADRQKEIVIEKVDTGKVTQPPVAVPVEVPDLTAALRLMVEQMGAKV